MEQNIELQGDVAAFQKWLANSRKWEDQFVQLTSRNPLESLLLMLVVGSVIFQKAEAGKNPKVVTIWDSLNFISTCASVGYTDIFARTQIGKIVSSMVMTFGPALCAKVFDRPETQSQLTPQNDKAIVERLDAILAELRQLRQNT